MRSFFNKLAVGNEIRVEYADTQDDTWTLVFTHDNTPTILRFRAAGNYEPDFEDLEFAVRALNDALSLAGRHITLSRIEATDQDLQHLHRPSFETVRQVCLKKDDWPDVDAYIFVFEATV